MLRNSIPLIILILFFLGLIRVIGERNGLYDSYFGAALFTVIRIFIFIALTFIISNTLNKLDLMRKQKEKELMESETKYNNIKDVDDLKSQFIAIVSHELRTPITIIKGFASFLAKGAAGEINQQQKEYAESIGLNANRLSKLVAEMVDISKIESGTFTIEKQAVAMKDLISSCVQELRYIADKSNIRLTEKNELPELVLFADKGRLEQAFTNLLNNGIKFSLYGSEILIGLKTADMSKIAKIEGWTPDEEKTYVLIYVRDTGCGVAPENIEKIFDRFFQAEDHKTRKYQGMGLGLSITKSIIEAHGGAIWCESEGINKGTVFYILLPE
jgi:signal transduction histidine kinase